MELFFKNMFNFAPHFFRGNSSVGRASASQAEGRGFESRFPLLQSCLKSDFRMAFFDFPSFNLVERFSGGDVEGLVVFSAKAEVADVFTCGELDLSQFAAGWAEYLNAAAIECDV